jgi:hypothetical protein
MSFLRVRFEAISRYLSPSENCIWMSLAINKKENSIKPKATK